MSDFGTIRTDYYKRKIPYGVPAETKGREPRFDTVARQATQALEDMSDKVQPAVDIVSGNPGGGWAATQVLKNAQSKMTPQARVKALMEVNPWLEQVLETIVKARLGMYASDEPWAKDKHYGWTEKVTPMPEPNEYFALNSKDPYHPYYDDTELAEELYLSDPTRYEEMRKPYDEWMATQGTELIPQTREEAGPDARWYPSTNDYMDALLATKLGEDSRQALFDAAQMKLAQVLQADLESEDPKYGGIAEQFLYPENPKGERWMKKNEFENPNALKVAASNFVAPARSAVSWDPELWYKTPDWEKNLRTGVDAALLATSGILPYGGARLGVTAMSRPGLGAFIGGAGGGLAQYGLERGVNEAFAEGTGYGTDRMPLNAVDAVTASLIGGVGGRVTGSRAARTKRNLQQMMNPDKPSSVTRGDVKSSLKYTGEAKGDRNLANRKFLREGYDDYEKWYNENVKPKYGDEIVQTLMAPPLRAKGLPLAQNLPAGSAKGYVYTSTTGPKVAKVGQGVNADKLMGDPLVIPVPGSKPVVIPRAVAWKTPTPEFTSAYIRENAPYFDNMTIEKKGTGGLTAAAKKAQVKGSEEAKYFTGAPEYTTGKEHAEKLSALRGNVLEPDDKKMANSFLADIRSGGKTGHYDVLGNWVEATETSPDKLLRKQAKKYGQAKKTYSRRAKQNMVNETDAEKAKGSMLTDVAFKKLPTFLAMPALRNIVPFGSNIALGINPIEYEE